MWFALARPSSDTKPGVDGRVTAYFSDGTSATADVLIGADGANSRVRQQLLPDAERIDTGILAIAGKHRLDGANLPRALREDANMIIPTGSGFLFTAVWQPDRTMIVEEPAPDGFLLDNSTAYTFWAYADQASRFPLDSRALSGTDLQGVVLDRTAGWAPALRELIGGSDPSTVNAIQVRSATPVDPWPTGRVTLLGDAIHNMTPMAGIGANTALRDADLLRRQLIAVASGERDLIPALHEYEEQMLDYGFAAVKRSLNNARQAGVGQPARSWRIPYGATRRFRGAAAATSHDQLAWSVSSASAEQRIDRCGDKKQCEIGIRPVKESHRLQRGVGQATPRARQQQC